ncbi:MAG: ATP-binding protein [Verrucomicrobia bacterium]|nr:ATP-binding protein [Verrucomicrobiota bacterium]MDA1065999.1 ATP-binding protein [Verrucomicrobiota bacterium]
MFIERTLGKYLEESFHQFPVITITGPRQSGKTTLCRHVFKKLPYVNLERLSEREFAREDPEGFLQRFPEGAIIDEIQNVPEILSEIQVVVDQAQRNGMFVLTGSQQYSLREALSQSLAGRTALFRLLPFALEELGKSRTNLSIDQLLYTGGFPRIYEQNLSPTQALGDYFETYVQRDLLQVSSIKNLDAFVRLTRLCAGRVGQMLNMQSLGSEVGVSQTTVKEWISLLESGYILFRLSPYHANIGKRLVKTPKLYFHDVGLVSYLLGIENPRHLESHPLRGQLFENLVVSELVKKRYHRGQRPDLHFYRDNIGNEVDVVWKEDEWNLLEIKSALTVTKEFNKGFNAWDRAHKTTTPEKVLVTGGEQDYTRSGIRVVGYRNFLV